MLRLTGQFSQLVRLPLRSALRGPACALFLPIDTQIRSKVTKLAQVLHTPDRQWSPFTPEEDGEILRLRTAGKTYTDIAKTLQRNIASICQRYERLAHPPVRAGNWAQWEDEALLRAQAEALKVGRSNWRAQFSRSIGRSLTSTLKRLPIIDPNLKHSSLTDQETQIIASRIAFAKQSGRSVPWAAISRELHRGADQVRKVWTEGCTSPLLGGWYPDDDVKLREQVELAAKAL
ncbi:hypothetical protein HK097_005005 [Rhizophlyctis rosea]|uniref:Myb-like domain-containing protein n=1 Tax=Rhizophlyctis rosea TaxID=64517 RepID=A0AAD5X5P3_9FUNG|nr:hypothetical protein HK097_005005 [Rhizophlyctis rosea]